MVGAPASIAVNCPSTINENELRMIGAALTGFADAIGAT
jgi:hypothetical protein